MLTLLPESLFFNQIATQFSSISWADSGQILNFFFVFIFYLSSIILIAISELRKCLWAKYIIKDTIGMREPPPNISEQKMDKVH